MKTIANATQKTVTQAKSGPSKARPTTIKQRHQEITQNPTLDKYSGMSLPKLRQIAKPLGIPGSGEMRKDELLQLFLLYDSELTATADDSDPVVQSSRSDKNQNADTGPSKENPVTRSRSRRCLTSSNHSTLEPSNRAAADNSNTTAGSLKSDKERYPGGSTSRSNDNCIPVSSTSRRCSTNRNLSPLDTLTEDHESDIKIDAEIFTTPDVQVVKGHTHHNQGSREERDERCLIDEGIEDQAMPLPSRGRGTALPRPRPTVLSEVAKGKQRRRSPSSDDWVPEASKDGNSPGSSSMELEGLDEDEGAELAGMDIDSADQDDSMSVSGASGLKEETDDDDGGARAAISRLLEACDNANDTSSGPGAHSGSRDRNRNDTDNQDLRQTVRDLTKLVMHLVSNSSSSTKPRTKVNNNKPRGSTFRARIRSHIRTMMGLKEDDAVPPSATPAQRSSWKIHTPRKSMLLPCRLNREVANGLNSSANDPRFPFKGGPGGEHSNPQILLIMWTMMNCVGVSSFHPIWEESPSSPTNTFLWNRATSTFIHLVKAGEYNDISAEDSKFDIVFKALKEHARSSLKRTFRQTNEWSQAKIRAHKKQGV
ncbi:uncharacterized protein MELLADRAFT_91130 [Melampsora larici-populina 98AG31]|uniref:Rho termination factor-like N-terminal domain-containing protein n=1 Tax=Melampsora larici-populina (strain 98AG31 / pathotype 3-4-7) TaxID=747676 RepID=F4R789_MELLP|nr:uncharacterized protein MELLADRAFT_91130 [Melampsora larici-populina 98AG31]EGG11561.1 hypothetical protein MELLADRAFT_91130 [Melampsora larici-populina 98AG31]